MPQPVIDRLLRYQTTEHANIHRGVHYLSEVATAEYEAARRKLQRFINAREEREVIFTSGTTDAINLVMHGYGRKFIGAGDEIILTALEHHSNIVPWQMLADEKGRDDCASSPSTTRASCCSTNTRRCSTSAPASSASTHVSNALGTHQPGQADDRFRARARRAGAGRRRASGAAHGGRRAGSRLRLLCLLRPQDVRPDRHRHPLRQGRAARADAARSRAAAT